MSNAGIVESSGANSDPSATRQKRLRHVKGIAGRNIQYNGQNTKFFSSEKLQGSINPSWKGFNLDHIPLKEVNTTKSYFVVKIWRGKDGDFFPCIIWEVNLSGLVYIGDKLQKEVDFPPNTLLFGMLNGYYIAPLEKAQPIVITTSDYFLTAELSAIRKSYSVSTLSRIQTVLRAIKQTEASGTSVRKQIEQKLSQAREIQRKKAHLEDIQSHMKQLQNDLEWRTRKLQTEKQMYETLQTSNTQQDMSQKKRYDTLKNDRARLHERKKKYFDVREELIKSGAQLVMRRKQLISELAFIYPIRELPNNVFTVAGVTLPNATEFHGANEVMLEVSLGYTCHLIHMISHFLDMPLRYPMEHRGSKSKITDHILDKLSEKERDFPIFSKGREKFHFEYGVYLLNKNIAQLRYYCGLGTTDLRLTLPNLKTLLQLRLGVKFDHYESFDPTKDAIIQKYASIQSNSSDNTYAETLEPKKRNRSEKNEKYHSTPKQCSGTLSPNKSDTISSNGSHSRSILNGNINKNIESQNDRYSERTNSSHVKDYSDDVFKRCSDDDDFFAIPKNHANEYFHSFDSDHKAPAIHFTQHSDEFETFHKPNSDSSVSNNRQRSTIQTLDELMKDKLLGPIANYQDIDVSSSEDSANAVYGSKIWPRMLDNLTVQHENNIPVSEDRTIGQLVNRDNQKNSSCDDKSKILPSVYNSSNHKHTDKDNTPVCAVIPQRTVSESSDIVSEEVSTFKTSAMHSEKNSEKIQDMINIDLDKAFENEEENKVECVSRNISLVEAGEGIHTSESEASFVDFAPTFKLNK